MHKTITLAVIKGLKPGAYTVFDQTERNLAIRVNPSGVKTWQVRLKTVDDEWYWWKLGSVKGLAPEAARVQAHLAKAEADTGVDLREAKRRRKADAARQITLRTFITDTYAPWVKAHQKRGEETVKTLETRCADLLDTSLSDLSAFAVEKWRSAYLKRGKAPATVNRVLDDLRACLSKAVAWGHLADHPLRSVRRAKLDTLGRVRFLTADEETRLRAALTAREAQLRAGRASFNAWRQARGYALVPDYTGYVDHLQPLVLVALLTGARRGELFDLRWSAVDLVQNRVTFTGSTTKTGLSRHVPLCLEAKTVMQTWRDQQHEAKREPGALVFPSPQGGDRLDNISTAWARVVTAAKLRDFTFHSLRHSFASKLVQAGVDLFVVQKLLGHATPTMTQRYSHLADEHLTAAIAKLG
jgi:integrase